MTRERELASREPEAAGDEAPGARGVEQEIASGRPASTPFALTGVVALVVWSVAAVVAAALFLVIWLS